MPNITADVLRAQCTELRLQLQALTEERDRWRDHAKTILALLPERLERTHRAGMREAYSNILTWCERHGSDTVVARIHQGLAATALGPGPATKQGCEWCLDRGYIFREGTAAICPACRKDAPR